MTDEQKAILNEYPWDSKEQMEGYFAYLHYCKTNKYLAKAPTPEMCFFIQKDIDSHAYWRDLMGNQITDLQNQIKILQDRIIELKIVTLETIPETVQELIKEELSK